jgi:hypothetical protein
MPRRLAYVFLATLLGCGQPRAEVGPDGGVAQGCAASCPTGELCAGGSCYPTSCASQACGPSQVCYEDGCVDQGCVGVSCGSAQICVAGECESTVCGSVACAPGDVCYQGQCVGSSCLGVVCPAGYLCAAGTCLPDSCGAVSCGDGGVCDDGGCVEADCVGTSCPGPTICLGGSCVVAGTDGGDGGARDGGVDDAGSKDGGPHDAGEADAGSHDAGADAGQPDSGPPACMPGPGLLCCGGNATPDDTLTNCGGCGVACAPANATGTCTTGSCAIAACAPGWGDCDGLPGDGCETQLGTTSDCTVCGDACGVSQPNQVAVCSGACGTACDPGYAPYAQYDCVNWAGHFQVNDAVCPCCAACENGNPFANGAACGCPAGFAQTAGYRAIDDCNGDHGSLVYFCETGSTSSQSPWGGAYELDDAVAGNEGCRASNAYTGGCSCPGGTTAASMRVIVDTATGLIGSSLVFCVNTGYPPQTFGGVYEQDDPVPGNHGCRGANPYTGGCSCPSGLGAQEEIRTLVDITGGFIGSTIFICSQ